MTLELESDLLSPLKPEIAYSAFNLNLVCLSLHPYMMGAGLFAANMSTTFRMRKFGAAVRRCRLNTSG